MRKQYYMMIKASKMKVSNKFVDYFLINGEISNRNL